MTNMSNMPDDGVDSAYGLNVQLSSGASREGAYKSKLGVMKKDLVKTRVKRVKLKRSVRDLVSKVLQSSADFNDALQVVVESSRRLYEDIANRVTIEMGQT